MVDIDSCTLDLSSIIDDLEDDEAYLYYCADYYDHQREDSDD